MKIHRSPPLTHQMAALAIVASHQEGRPESCGGDIVAIASFCYSSSSAAVALRSKRHEQKFVLRVEKGGDVRMGVQSTVAAEATAQR